MLSMETHDGLGVPNHATQPLVDMQSLTILLLSSSIICVCSSLLRDVWHIFFFGFHIPFGNLRQLMKMAIELVNFPIKDGDFAQLCKFNLYQRVYLVESYERSHHLVSVVITNLTALELPELCHAPKISKTHLCLAQIDEITLVVSWDCSWIFLTILLIFLTIRI